MTILLRGEGVVGVADVVFDEDFRRLEGTAVAFEDEDIVMVWMVGRRGGMYRSRDADIPSQQGGWLANHQAWWMLVSCQDIKCAVLDSWARRRCDGQNVDGDGMEVVGRMKLDDQGGRRGGRESVKAL